MEEAKSTSQLVKEEINSSIFVLESLKNGIINYSELARQILPKIKGKNNKANFQSVLIAIQRYYDEIKKQESFDIYSDILKDSELIMKNNIVDIALERTKKVIGHINEISKEIRWDMGDIMFVTQGTGEITLIIDKKNLKKFDKLKTSILEKNEGLAILSLREPEDLSSYSKGASGFLALLTTSLADKGINIVELETTYKQTIFVINEKDLSNAYETLSKLIGHYKNK